MPANQQDMRDAGFSGAVGYRDELAPQLLCAFNGVDPKIAPPGWWVHPNKSTRAAWQRVADVVTRESAALLDRAERAEAEVAGVKGATDEGCLSTIVNEMLAGMIGCRASDIRSDDIAQCNFDVVDTATRIFAAIAPLIRAAERERCAAWHDAEASKLQTRLDKTRGPDVSHMQGPGWEFSGNHKAELREGLRDEIEIHERCAAAIRKGDAP
jgi:hypothetical protein